MNKVKVTICGKEFSLKTDDSPSYMTGLAKKVDTAIADMMSSSANLPVQSAAILTALAAYDELQKANDSIDNIRSQIKEYVDDAGKARAERDRAVKSENALKAKISALENELKIKQMKSDIDRQLTLDMSDTSANKQDNKPIAGRQIGQGSSQGGKPRK
ncbi:MAG: cell division protein ZapA [Oscillospiraceae bacterium]|nr:cell division protein ZapA [Oscillospiraceae bacterium]